MRNDRLHLIAAGFFACAFVLAGSGWSSVLATLMNQRPDWSVCGQDMCSCVKPTEVQPDCPLCEAGLMDPADMLADEACQTQKLIPVRRVPKNHIGFSAVSDAGSSAVVAMFVGMMMHSTIADLNSIHTRVAMTLINDRLPSSNPLDAPTPPPRA